MKREDGTVRAPGGRMAPLRRARTAENVGQALEPGVIVETDLATAEACGAWLDDVDAAEAFEAAMDPADFGEGAGDGPQ